MAYPAWALDANAGLSEPIPPGWPGPLALAYRGIRMTHALPLGSRSPVDPARLAPLAEPLAPVGDGCPSVASRGQPGA